MIDLVTAVVPNLALINDGARLDGVQVLGVDEHVWRHTLGVRTGRSPSIIDLTPVREGTGSARLLEMVPGRFQGGVQDLARRSPNPRTPEPTCSPTSRTTASRLE